MKRMTYERLAELTEPPWGGTPLERELLQALKLEREEVKSRGEMMELWSEEIATDRERIAELEAQLDAVAEWQKQHRKLIEYVAESYPIPEALGGDDE